MVGSAERSIPERGVSRRALFERWSRVIPKIDITEERKSDLLQNVKSFSRRVLMKRAINAAPGFGLIVTGPIAEKIGVIDNDTKQKLTSMGFSQMMGAQYGAEGRVWTTVNSLAGLAIYYEWQYMTKGQDAIADFIGNIETVLFDNKNKAISELTPLANPPTTIDGKTIDVK